MHDHELTPRCQAGLAEQRVPFAWRLLLRAAARIEEGRLEIVLPDRQRFIFGTGPGRHARLVVREPAMIRRLITRGDLGFAEAYLAGEWESPCLVDLLELLDRNRAAFGGIGGGRWFARLADWLQHTFANRNTRSGARRNIAAHYDLGNDFYRLWLDETMTYSAAIFSSPEQPLAEAQLAKFRRLLDGLGLQPGQHLLEIGSGWGACAILAAREYGVRVTSITLSREQLDEATARAAAAGVADRVEFRLQDYRDLSGEYDAIVSCEMFEAVGEAWWPAFFHTVHDRLRPGGRAAIQVITIGAEFFADYRRGVDFIQRYIFPGGMLPTVDGFAASAAAAGLVTEQRACHGADYARTLARWDRAVFAARPQLLGQGFDERFLRMWHYYLAYCEAGFRTGHCDLLQTRLLKPRLSNPRVP